MTKTNPSHIAKLALEHEKRSKNREVDTANQWTKIDVSLQNAYHLAKCSILGLHHKSILHQDLTDKEILKFVLIHTSFIRGIPLTEFAIKAGYYAQAHNLIKAEIESVAAAGETISGHRKDGATPSVKKLEEPVRKMYGFINKVAHPGGLASVSSLVSESNKGENQLSTFPIFYLNIAQSLFSLHVGMVIDFTRAVANWLQFIGDKTDLSTEAEFNGKAAIALNKYLNREKA